MIIVIAQIFGLISWLLLMYSYTKEDIDKLLWIQIAVCAFDFISYFMLGADSGLLICLFELVKTILYYKMDNDNQIFLISCICYFFIGLTSLKSIFTLLPVIGSVIDSYGCSKDSKQANIASVISNSLWAIYDIYILSYIGAINDVTVVICNICVLLFGYKKMLKINKFRILKYSSLDYETIEKFNKLDEKRFGKHVVWDSKSRKSLFQNNKNIVFVVKYKTEIMGYVNAYYITPSYYDKLMGNKPYSSYKPTKEDIKTAQKKVNNILFIERININKKYEGRMINESIEKKICRYIHICYKKKIPINKIVATVSDELEEKIVLDIGFKMQKHLTEKIRIFVLEESDIKQMLRKYAK